ncbi:MAG: threonylcarbamoyl-AMP synthase [Clostridia bacterium]|nr:threonylcarbamoyl-AMP synthase [Clostridia bacterium]
MSKFYNWKDRIKDNELDEIVDIIKQNGVIVFPTETVYGIGGNALSKNVIEKIYNIKQRPLEKALSILVKNKEEIKKYAYISNSLEEKIIDNFMPGPITIILKKRENKIQNFLTKNDDTIGIRIPNNNIVKNILEKCNLPIAAPSANISGKPSSIKLEDIKQDFEGKVDAFIDGGICKQNIPSTIVKVIDGEIKVLREGIIPINVIREKIM